MWLSVAERRRAEVSLPDDHLEACACPSPRSAYHQAANVYLACLLFLISLSSTS